MAVRQPSCRLESLHTDIQIAILSTSTSAADLYSLLRASPILYETSLHHKNFILLRLNFHLLGPVGIRDAIFLTHTYTKDPKTTTQNASLETIIRVYRNLTLPTDDDEAGGCPLSGELEWDTILGVTHLANTVVYLSELYVRTRFAYFRRQFYPYFTWGNDEEEDATANNPWCDWPASITELHRIRTALLRCEIAHGFNGEFPKWERDRTIEPFMCTILPVWEAWEWEQISQMDRFLNTTRHLRGIEEAVYYNRGRWCPKKPETPDPHNWRVGRWRRHQEEFRRNLNPLLGLGVLGRLRRDLEELETFVAKLFQQAVVDLAVSQQRGNWIEWLDGSDTWQRLVKRLAWNSSYLFSTLTASYNVDWGDEEAAKELGIFCLLPVVMRTERRFRPGMYRFEGDTVESEWTPPRAWVEAMDGRNYAHVWGVSLAGLPEPSYPDPTLISDYDEDDKESDDMTDSEGEEPKPDPFKNRKRLLDLWRRMGLVFWDKKRAEAIIEQTEGIEAWGTGWLERWIRLYYVPRRGGIQVDHDGLVGGSSNHGKQVVKPPREVVSVVPAAPGNHKEPSLWEYQVNG